ncbi:hypothetical protein QTH87_19805 [Variovorax sp. J22P168]|uniref:hypothetical protein n=1 Tax=Variovorax jilinensis TaxID=3053513 RepID=UPI002578D7BD|nr:hypothetical protein [Variovorax sp. J22P168]MDM0014698.1 hypothetical protein [Variovorax sp. J22P168]
MRDMNPLPRELDRLYGLGTDGSEAAAAAGAGASARQGDVRVLVLEVVQPAGWEQLSPVWRGVQSDLGLPAPAIAVSGVDGLQLWFSLASPTPPHAGDRFLQGLRTRYLSDVASAQVRLIAGSAGSPAAPPVQVGPDRWSAFLAPDLVPVFADTPWLDVRPNDEGQATLLRALQPMRSADLEAASRQLGAIGADEALEPPAFESPGSSAGQEAPARGDADAERFLRRVMKDETAPLALRVDAAKALLAFARGA